jgi:hypothetical protein
MKHYLNKYNAWIWLKKLDLTNASYLIIEDWQQDKTSIEFSISHLVVSIDRTQEDFINHKILFCWVMISNNNHIIESWTQNENNICQ